jgi:hypothetical protein
VALVFRLQPKVRDVDRIELIGRRVALLSREEAVCWLSNVSNPDQAMRSRAVSGLRLMLNPEQRQLIKQSAIDCVGANASVRLFGSRVDDSKRGGDIDLLISTRLSDAEQILRSEIDFQVRVQQALGEQRIDLLIDYPGRRVRPPIFAMAERTGVPL